MKFKNISTVYNRMPGIITTLKTGYNICLRCQVVYTLAFPFVAPLGSDYNQTV